MFNILNDVVNFTLIGHKRFNNKKTSKFTHKTACRPNM